MLILKNDKNLSNIMINKMGWQIRPHEYQNYKYERDYKYPKFSFELYFQVQVWVPSTTSQHNRWLFWF